MKKALILVFLFAVPLRAQENAERVAWRFARLPLAEQIMANLPEGREEEVLNVYTKRNDAYYHEVLLRLNHRPTVEKLLGDFKKQEGKSNGLRKNIERSGSPYLIAELAPQLYKSDVLVARFFDDTGADLGESAQAAEMIGQLIIRAPEFPPEAKAWAKAHLGMPSNDIINAARAWWELNQSALLANQFDQVRQPESYPKGPPLLGQSSPPPVVSPSTAAPAPEPAPLPPTPPEPPEPAPAPATPPPTPPQTPPAELPPPRWWIVAALATLAAGLLLARRRKS